MSERLERAAEYLGEAFLLIDQLGQFFAVEHAWAKSENWVDYEWPEKVNTRIDHIGYVVPEMYETLIHLSHALREMLLEMGEEK